MPRFKSKKLEFMRIMHTTPHMFSIYRKRVEIERISFNSLISQNPMLEIKRTQIKFYKISSKTHVTIFSEATSTQERNTSV